VLAAGALRRVPVAVAVDPQVGGEQVEPVALRRADDERVAYALVTQRRGEHGTAAVQLVPVQRVVAPAGGEVHLFAVGRAFSREVEEHVARVCRRCCCRGRGEETRREYGEYEESPHGESFEVGVDAQSER
jgi:hypothetical protein